VRCPSVEDLQVPPGNRLEALKGQRAGQHSIRVNDQCRIRFYWSETARKAWKSSTTTEKGQKWFESQLIAHRFMQVSSS